MAIIRPHYIVDIISPFADAIIRKMTRYHSDEFERYNHLSPELSKQTTELIVRKLVEELKNTEIGTFWSQSDKNEKTAIEAISESSENKDVKSINN